MKRYLIRAGMTPFESLSVPRIIARDYIGGNAGNLIYQGSVMRALMTSEDVEFVPDRLLYNQNDAGWINDSSDAYIIAMADAFRPDVDELNRVTNLVRSLKVPCVVVGAGLRCELNKDPIDEHPFDDDVRAFMEAVLEKSATVGLRGQTTAAYLEHLGFHESEHFRVIGCPSMYWGGATLPRRALELSPDARINVNMNVYSRWVANRFLLQVLDSYPNSVYTAQTVAELQTLYLAEEYTTLNHKDTPDASYPRHITDDLYVQDRVRFFLGVRQWMDFLSGMNLSVGGRMHGNIAAIQAGCPTALIVKDRRMAELVEFHALPHMVVSNVKPAWSLEEFLSHIDWDAMYAVHDDNFANYVRFLDENGLGHVFSGNGSPELGSLPFDCAVDATSPQEMPATAAGLTAEQLAQRWRSVVEEERIFRDELATRTREHAVAEAVASRRLGRRIARKLGLR